jgi:hypothetical protein
MSVTQATIEQLFRDRGDLEDLEIATVSSLFGSYYRGNHGPVQTFWLQDKLQFRLDREQWSLFSTPDAFDRVHFQRGPDVHTPGREGLVVWLFGRDHGHGLAFHLQRLYDEQGEPIAARFALWEELRAKYGGCDQLRVENGRLTPLS